ncbi:MAG TPA: sigma-E factor regulatory protein RseB domain-containing protein [Candidatus Lustribacter sp.]
MRRCAVAFAMAAACLLPAAIMAAQPTPTPAPAPSDSNALVRAAFDAPRHVSYVGQLQTIRWGTRVASATIQRVEHRAPSSTRRTFLAPEALYGEYDITLGTTTTKIDPKQHRAMISENPSSDNASAMNNNIALLAANYRAVIGPVEIVAARPATTISLVNRYTGERMMRLWIDNETKVVLAKEAYHQDGSLAWRSRFDEIRFTGEIPSGVFSTAIPAGFQEVEGRRFADMTDDLQRALDGAGFKAANPRYLPNGFRIIGAENSTFRGLRNLHLLYSDGIRTLSLFENNTDSEPDFGGVKPSVTHFEGHDAQYVKDGPTLLLTWREHGLDFALIGDLDLKNLTAIAVSIIP